MRYLNILLLKIIVSIICNAQSITNYDCLKFNSYINFKNIDDQTIENDDDGFYGFPFHKSLDSTFINISKESVKNINCFKSLLKNKNIKNRRKFIGLMLMQSLEIKEYLQVLNIVTQAFKNNLVNEEILISAFDQKIVWSNAILLNTENKKFKKILADALSLKSLTYKNKKYLKNFNNKKWVLSMLKAYEFNKSN